jgi:hypothetical protein
MRFLKDKTHRNDSMIEISSHSRFLSLGHTMQAEQPWGLHSEWESQVLKEYPSTIGTAGILPDRRSVCPCDHSHLSYGLDSQQCSAHPIVKVLVLGPFSSGFLASYLSDQPVQKLREGLFQKQQSVPHFTETLEFGETDSQVLLLLARNSM